MKLWRIMAIVLVVFSLVTAGAAANTYTWDGISSPADWNDEGNWLCKGNCLCGVGNCGYPDDSGDDALIQIPRVQPYPPIIVDTITLESDLTIDDLTISTSVDFEGATAVTLTVDSFTIVGGAIVTITDATITAP